MSITRIDCQFHRYPLAGERSGYVALNPSGRPGSLVFAGSSAAREGISSQVASKLSREHFVSAVLDYFARVEQGQRQNLGEEEISLEVLESAFKNANTSVYSFGHKLAAGGRMAASLLGIVVEKKVVAAGRVGPGSAYLYRGGELFPFFESRQFGSDTASLEQLIGAHSIVSVELSSVPVAEDDIIVAFSEVLDSDTELQLTMLLAEEPLIPEASLVDYHMRRIIPRLFGEPNEVLFAMVARIGPEAIYLGTALERR
ncbi:MAG: hypothetical protein J0M12_11760 [Deltaproteobacteria bacterium]|nr:hypothetical protein [Deltaproteobacteria bacterium]